MILYAKETQALHQQSKPLAETSATTDGPKRYIRPAKWPVSIFTEHLLISFTEDIPSPSLPQQPQHQVSWHQRKLPFTCLLLSRQNAPPFSPIANNQQTFNANMSTQQSYDAQQAYAAEQAAIAQACTQAEQSAAAQPGTPVYETNSKDSNDWRPVKKTEDAYKITPFYS